LNIAPSLAAWAQSSGPPQGGVPPGPAQELRVWSGGAAQSGLRAAAALFSQRYRTTIHFEFAPMGPLARRLAELAGGKAEAGPAPDVIVLTEEAMKEARSKGWIAVGPAGTIGGPATDAGGVVEVGRTGIGIAVNEKAPLPDIKTAAGLKQTLLAAKSIVYIDPARGTSGRHVAAMFEALGIAEAMKGKTTLGQGGHVVEPVGRGEIELGLHQITEILPVKGVKLAGPLPEPFQRVTVYQGAVAAKARAQAAAQHFLIFLRLDEVRKLFAAQGFIEPK
jgi:molybdate transport system substrate-binding protein